MSGKRKKAFFMNAIFLQSPNTSQHANDIYLRLPCLFSIKKICLALLGHVRKFKL